MRSKANFGAEVDAVAFRTPLTEFAHSQLHSHQRNLEQADALESWAQGRGIPQTVLFCAPLWFLPAHRMRQNLVFSHQVATEILAMHHACFWMQHSSLRALNF